MHDNKKILTALESTTLNKNYIFYEEKNEDFILSLGNKLFNGKYYYENGISKFVIIPLYENYVIKIPYTGYLDSDENSSSKNFYYQPDGCYSDFFGGEDEKRPWDYCATEVLRYSIAKEYNFNFCFAETKFIGFSNGYPIYIQEKCVPLSSCSREHSYSIEERVMTSNICNYYNINGDWLTDFRLYYGNNILVNFVNFLKNMDWDDDLRSSNIGYINHRPVLIDYSGFLE